MKTKLFVATSALAAMMWAVPSAGAAHFIIRPDAGTVSVVQTAPVRFKSEDTRGLLLRVWINGKGPYVFALDTGAGMNVISQRVVGENRWPTKAAPTTYVGGLSDQRIPANREAIINRMALGEMGNTLSSAQTALVVTNLPPDIDGIIDPTEAYPGGYSIDLPRETLTPLTSGLSADGRQTTAGEGAVVSWVRKGSDSRPFVRLGDGRIALIDTGSRFGLAVSDRNAIIVGSSRESNSTSSRDIAGGIIRTRRVDPTTITIGGLVLRRIPTDIVFGAHKDAPLILGREALYPFKISFDPQKRLIEFVAV